MPVGHPRTTYHRAWRKRNPEKFAAAQRRSHLKLLYGLTPEAYDALLAGQKGGCAICGKRDAGRKPDKRHRAKKHRLFVDHDHATKKVRGLLCYRCNIVLGLIDDDPKRALKMARYLRT